MVDASLNATTQKSAAPASKAPAAAPKIDPAPAVPAAAPRVEKNGPSSTVTVAEASAKQPAAEQSTPIVSKVSGLATYRDHESGRLVVQIFDQKRGDVILEFPTENMLRAYPTTPSSPSIDHVIETKA